MPFSFVTFESVVFFFVLIFVSKNCQIELPILTKKIFKTLVIQWLLFRIPD